MKWYLIGAVLLFFLIFYPWNVKHIERPDGILVTGEPWQRPLAGGKSWDYKGCRVVALAEYSVRARLILRERYFWGREADLAPFDLTVGWGMMSDQRVLDRLSLHRGHRSFRWRGKNRDLPAPMEQLNAHSANMHIIPADDAALESLHALLPGHLVDMAGYLVRVECPGGWQWRSSLSRTDAGEGACELMWVESLRYR